MAFITPFTLDDLDTREVIEVNWNILAPFSPDKTELARMTVAQIAEYGEFCTSMINCVHPDGGKFWDSMFIPTNPTGGTGVSVTCWGKAATKGQFQVKSVSETEWYKTVKSKAVSGGYDVKNFVGRMTPLQSDHKFVRDIHDDPSIPTIPALCFAPQQKSKIGTAAGPEGLGYVMGKASANIIPTEQFLRSLHSRGHAFLPQLHQATAAQDTSCQDLMTGFVRGVQESHGTTLASKPAAPTRPVEPQVDREEVYGGGWGAFG